MHETLDLHMPASLIESVNACKPKSCTGSVLAAGNKQHDQQRALFHIKTFIYKFSERGGYYVLVNIAEKATILLVQYFLLINFEFIVKSFMPQFS